MQGRSGDLQNDEVLLPGAGQVVDDERLEAGVAGVAEHFEQEVELLAAAVPQRHVQHQRAEVARDPAPGHSSSHTTIACAHK